MAKLKVFRTPIGFHDAYVAAPSQKAALEAWGADADLFARGVAERVDDPALTREPLERPGEIVKLSRGAAGDHFRTIEKVRSGAATKGRKAARPPSPRLAPARATRDAPQPREPEPPKKKRPRPSRAGLERAEAALSAADADLAKGLEEIAMEEKALKDRRQVLRERHAAHRTRLEAMLKRARTDYRAKIERWASE